MRLQTEDGVLPAVFHPFLEDAMNMFTQLQRFLDPDSGGFVLAVVAVSLAAALVLVLAP